MKSIPLKMKTLQAREKTPWLRDAHGKYSGSFMPPIWQVTSICNAISKGLNALLPKQEPGTHVKHKQNIHTYKSNMKYIKNSFYN